MTTARFCTSCGSTLAPDTAACSACAPDGQVECPGCHATVGPGSRFCAVCGVPVATRQEARRFAAESLPPSSERREVTVIFADATDFTSVSSQLDNEEVYHYVDEAMRLLAGVVSDYEGTVDKYMGDGLMAIFGAPATHEDDAERAVRAAWEMQRIMEPFRDRLRSEGGFDFRIRIGVHTGEVVAGSIGSSDVHSEYTVIGDTVNLASRLQAAADPCSVLVSETTHARTAWYFAYEEGPPLALKGIPRPVTAYRLCGMRGQRTSRRGLPGLRTPLVGREEQLQQLHGLMQRLTTTGQQELVLITGQAGLGKTRLVHDFVSSIDPSIVIIESRCPSYGRSRPLYLAAEMLSAVIGIDPSDTPQAQVAAIRAFIVRYQLEETEDAGHTEVLPFILSVLGLTAAEETAEEHLRLFDDTMLQQQTHTGLRRAILAVAAGRPLALILDDLQWVDSASREFLQFFIDSTADQPVALFLISRDLHPDAAATPLIETLSRRFRALHLVDVPPLTSAQAQQLALRIIPGFSKETAALRRSLVEKAEGNPLYLEELVRTLIERKVLVGDPGRWEVDAAASSKMGEVPATLRGVILARFDALPGPIRGIAQRAAVLGRSFPLRLLQQITGKTLESLTDALDSLEEGGFLQRESFGIDKGFAFTHAIVQEAIHGTLLRRERQRLHDAVAAAIAGASWWPAAERHSVLAHHYAESADPPAAIPYLITAAEYSARRYAHDVAVEHCRRALSIIGEQRKRDEQQYYRIRLILGRSLKSVASLTETRASLASAVDELRHFIASHEDVDHVPLFIELLRELADVEAREGLLDCAYQRLEEASLAAAAFNAASRVVLGVTDRMAWVRFRQGRPDDALFLADSAIQKLTEDSETDPATLANLYNTLGGVLWQHGKLDGAAEYVRNSLNLYHRIGYLFGKAVAHMNLGVLAFMRGDWKQAAESFERSDWIRREIGHTVGRAANLRNLALLRMAVGDYAAARANLGTALRIAREVGEEPDVCQILMTLAHLDILESRFEEASRLIDEVRLKDVTTTDHDAVQIGWLSAMVVAERSVVDAVRVAEEAHAGAKRLRVPETQADCGRVLGMLYARARRAGEARRVLQESIDLSRKLSDQYREAQALLELADAEVRCGDPAAQALTAGEEALRLFTFLGATQGVEKALRVLHSITRLHSPEAHSGA